MAWYARWTALFLAVTFLTALIEPWVVKGLESTGYYEDPTRSLGYARNWIERIIGTEAFPWLAAGVLGLALGMWIDALLRRSDANRPSPERLATDLAKSAIKIRHFVRDAGLNLTTYAPPEIDGEIQSAMHRLRKLGIPDPRGDIPDVVLRAATTAHFFDSLRPFLRNRQIKEARRFARDAKRSGQYSGAKDLTPLPP